MRLLGEIAFTLLMVTHYLQTSRDAGPIMCTLNLLEVREATPQGFKVKEPGKTYRKVFIVTASQYEESEWWKMNEESKLRTLSKVKMKQ
ncbi:hypothetical protein GGU10DRAFT_339400 [Lentinula aff. detonsa]|uniref:Secreted protein n=1 Tax=Lentinula aff. detonsa TaxID=2804958 RepID=A0AA38U290_9AGAR|nr:hypothetical protein GGU10DRAFT_339400 [Lentinula aff. detonsa]